VTHCDGDVKGYLGTIAFRLALKERERAGRCVNIEDADRKDRNPDPLEEMLLEEREKIAIDAIRKLNAKLKDVMVLRLYSGHSYEKIAELLRISLGTVKSRMFNAVKACREELRRKGVLE
jgi:RNA polymerase sigma-70 factor (ECF subfamily)